MRFFAEEGADHCLWGDEDDPGQLEGQLPIPEELRARMRAWVTEFNTRTQQGRPGPWTQDAREEFDRRGYELSRELQRVLGDRYEVVYRFQTAAIRQSAESPDGRQPVDHLAEKPKVRRLSEVLRAVAVLALPAEVQRDWLAARGDPVSADGLVLDIYETAPQATLLADAGWISHRAAEHLLELLEVLNQMSGPGHQHLWKSGALDAPQWDPVRRLALAVLIEL